MRLFFFYDTTLSSPFLGRIYFIFFRGITRPSSTIFCFSLEEIFYLALDGLTPFLLCDRVILAIEDWLWNVAFDGWRKLLWDMVTRVDWRVTINWLFFQLKSIRTIRMLQVKPCIWWFYEIIININKIGIKINPFIS